MKLLPKPQITLLVDAETGKEYKFIPYRLLPGEWPIDKWIAKLKR